MSEDHWQVALRHAPPGEVPSLRFPEGTTTKAPVAEHTQPPPSSVYSEPHESHTSLDHRGAGYRSGAGTHRGDRGASEVGALAPPQQQSRWVLVDDVITSQEVSQAAHRQRLSELTVRVTPRSRAPAAPANPGSRGHCVVCSEGACGATATRGTSLSFQVSGSEIRSNGCGPVGTKPQDSACSGRIRTYLSPVELQMDMAES